MRPKTYLFPGTRNGWRADKPITPKVIWEAVQTRRRLPILSTYLGHAHVTDTYWYLTGTPELLGAAGKKLEKRWEALNAGSR